MGDSYLFGKAWAAYVGWLIEGDVNIAIGRAGQGSFGLYATDLVTGSMQHTCLTHVTGSW